MDFNNIDSVVYGNDEDDDELMAELLALEREEKNVPKQLVKQPASGKRIATQLQPLNIETDEFDECVDEGLEDDEELQSELSKLVEIEDVPINRSKPAVSPIPPIRPVPPIPPRKDISPEKLLAPSSNGDGVVESNIGHSASSASRQLNSIPEKKEPPFRVEHKETPMQEDSVNKGPDIKSKPNMTSNEISPKDKIKRILIKRRDAFINNAMAAKQADDKESAVEYLNMVKMFKEAIQAADQVELSEADLAEVPKTPPPYRKKAQPTTLVEDLEARMAKYQELVEKYTQQGENQRARMNARMISNYKEAIATVKKGKPFDVTTLPVPPGFQPLAANSYQPSIANKPNVKHVPSDVPGTSQKSVQSEQQSQLVFLLTRQIQYKQAAIDAKKRGDMETAKKMLMNAKSIDPMIEASRSGLPVNIAQVPIAPQTEIPSGFVQPTISKATPNNASILEKEIIKQISLCEQLRTQFTRIGDAKSILNLEALLNETKKDLLFLRQSMKTGQLPRYSIKEVKIPSVEKHIEIPDDVLQLKILSINNLKLPEGWKPSHCNISVAYDFPFPHEKHQIGKTQYVGGTDNPEFSDTFQLIINRKSRQLARSIKRSLKLEIYQKGSLFRSDKLWGVADVPLIDLEKYASLTKTVDIMDQRRKTGGTISIEVCVSHPISTEARGTQTVTKKWLKINR